MLCVHLYLFADTKGECKISFCNTQHCISMRQIVSLTWSYNGGHKVPVIYMSLILTARVTQVWDHGQVLHDFWEIRSQILIFSATLLFLAEPCFYPSDQYQFFFKCSLYLFLKYSVYFVIIGHYKYYAKFS